MVNNYVYYKYYNQAATPTRALGIQKSPCRCELQEHGLLATESNLQRLTE